VHPWLDSLVAAPAALCESVVQLNRFPLANNIPNEYSLC
jgi:hypothetical protein